MEKRDFQPESRLPRPLYNQVISRRYLPKKNEQSMRGFEPKTEHSSPRRRQKYKAVGIEPATSRYTMRMLYR